MNFDALFSAISVGHSTKTEYTVALGSEDGSWADSTPTVAIRPRQQVSARISSFNDWSRTWNEFFQVSVLFGS